MKELVIIIVKYLKRELSQNKLNPDAAEGVEVAVQCLENAYNITSEDVEGCALALEDLYLAASYTPEEGRIVTQEQREEAEKLKVLGNSLMKEGRYIEAIGHYSRAIDLDPKNTVYFCNRAAAHIQTQNFLAAINDCHEAIRLDPNYSKAHSRLGYAYQAVGNRVRARDCYAKALDIEPDNESYRNSYQKLLDQGTGNTRPVSELMGLLPGIDLSAIMKNPSFVQMASQMLEDPGMQNAVTRILSGQSSFPMGQVEELISAGQQLADRLQSHIDMQQQRQQQQQQQQQGDGSSNVQQPHEACDSEGLAGKEPEANAGNHAMEQEPTISTTVQPPQASAPVSGSEGFGPQNSVGNGGKKSVTTDVKEKGQGPDDMDMGNEGGSADQ